MEQQILEIENVDLLNKVMDMKNAGCRLVLICAVKLEKFMLLYSFMKNGELVTFRIYVDAGEPVESISRLFSYSYLYENEMKDLFGINMINMRINYNGHIYETALKTPFNPAPENPAQEVQAQDTSSPAAGSEKSETTNNG